MLGALGFWPVVTPISRTVLCVPTFCLCLQDSFFWGHEAIASPCGLIQGGNKFICLFYVTGNHFWLCPMLSFLLVFENWKVEGHSK